MKKIILSIIILFLLEIPVISHVNHYVNFNYLEYELFRNNKSIGYHKYNFKRNGSNLTIDNEVEFKITKLGLDLYKYYAKGVEKYKNGIFSSFNSETNQNKKEKYVNITVDQNDKSLIIDGSSFKGREDKDTIIGTWWNHEIVQKKAQISAVSGRIIEQKVEFIGKEKVKIGDRSQEQLIEHTKKVGMDCIIKAIDMIYNDEVKIIENNSDQMTYFSFPTKEDVKDFNRRMRKIEKEEFLRMINICNLTAEYFHSEDACYSGRFAKTL